MGGVSRRKSAGISVAKTAGRRLHRVLLRNRGTSERLRVDARKLSRAMRRGFSAVAVLAWRTLPQYYSDQSRHRLHGRLRHAVYGRWNRGASAHFAAGIHSRSVHAIQDHLHGGCAADPEKSGARLARAVCRVAPNKAALVECTGACESRRDSPASQATVEPGAAEEGSPGVWRRIARAPGWGRLHRT